MRNECSMVGEGWSGEGALVRFIYEGDGKRLNVEMRSEKRCRLKKLSDDDKGKGKERQQKYYPQWGGGVSHHTGLWTNQNPSTISALPTLLVSILGMTPG